MRNTLINAIELEAEQNKSLFVITGDLGFGVFDKFSTLFPDQFINAGVSEQNMTSLACGMALEGAKVFTYSIGNFSTLRCLEQIRNDICYHNTDVTVITVGAGFSYGQLGVSHFATEDIAIMRALPNLTIISPCSPIELDLLFPQLMKINQPKYIRIDKSSATLPFVKPVKLGSPTRYLDGDDVVLVSTGGIVDEALKVADLLSKKNISVRVLSVHTLKPINTNSFISELTGFNAVYTLEEHSIIGGLGSLVSEIIMESNLRPKKFKKLGIRDVFPRVVGDQSYLRNYFRITAPSIAELIINDK